MNCKRGDLAVVVADELSENIDRLVSVIAAAKYWLPAIPEQERERINAILAQRLADVLGWGRAQA